MQIIFLLITGLIIGVLARLIKPGRQRLSVPATLGLGVVGAIIGALISSFFGKGTFTERLFELNVIGFILAVIAAVLLIGVAEGMSGRSRSRTHA